MIGSVFNFFRRAGNEQILRGGGFSLEMPATAVRAWRRPEVRELFGLKEAPKKDRYFAEVPTRYRVILPAKSFEPLPKEFMVRTIAATLPELMHVNSLPPLVVPRRGPDNSPNLVWGRA